MKTKKFNVIQLYDHYRCPKAYILGGFKFKNSQELEKNREILHTMVWNIGRFVINGGINLANVAFPIWYCSPFSIL